MALYEYGVTFNGRRVVHPGAYSEIDATDMVVATSGNASLPVLMGASTAGVPNKLVWFTDPDLAKAYLRGGDLYNAIDLVFSPAPGGGSGVSAVGVMPVNALVQAALTSGTSTFKSKEYGDGGNKISVSLSNGSISGTYKIGTFRWDLNTVESFDNLGAVMQLQYTGTSAYAEVNVTVVNNIATQLQTKIGSTSGTAVADVTLDLTTGQYSTIQDIVTYFSSISNYTVDYVSYWNYNLSTSLLDALSAVPIKTVNYLKAVSADIEKQINGYSNLISITTTGTPTILPSTYLIGGVVGATPASWATQFDSLKSVVSNILIPLTASPAIHAEALAHVSIMEQKKQLQMLFVGGSIGETVVQTKQRAATLDSSRAVLCYPGIYHKSINNGFTVAPSYFTAVMIVGIMCGLDVAEPITFKYLDLIGIENDYLVGDADIDDLITSGVCMLERVLSGGIRIVQGITTYTDINNTLYREISVRRVADYISSKMTTKLEDTYVGKKGTTTNITAVTSTVKEVLTEALTNDQIVAYKDIVVTFSDTVVTVDYKVAPVEPIDYILVTSHFIPSSKF